MKKKITDFKKHNFLLDHTVVIFPFTYTQNTH